MKALKVLSLLSLLFLIVNCQDGKPEHGSGTLMEVIHKGSGDVDISDISPTNVDLKANTIPVRLTRVDFIVANNQESRMELNVIIDGGTEFLNFNHDKFEYPAMSYGDDVVITYRGKSGTGNSVVLSAYIKNHSATISVDPFCEFRRERVTLNNTTVEIFTEIPVNNMVFNISILEALFVNPGSFFQNCGVEMLNGHVEVSSLTIMATAPPVSAISIEQLLARYAEYHPVIKDGAVYAHRDNWSWRFSVPSSLSSSLPWTTTWGSIKQ